MFGSNRPREVRCLHCHRGFTVPARATVLTCPACSKRVRVDDVVVNRATFEPRVETCGKIVVKSRGKITANVVQAGMGIQVQGELDAGHVAADEVLLGDCGRWRGDLTCAVIKVMPGATILGGRFTIDRALANRTTGAAQSV